MVELLQELNLGASDLVNPKTRRKLAKLFNANIIVTGNLAHFDIHDSKRSWHGRPPGDYGD